MKFSGLMILNDLPEKPINYNQDDQQNWGYTMTTGTKDNGDQMIIFGLGYCDDNTRYNGTK